MSSAGEQWGLEKRLAAVERSPWLGKLLGQLRQQDRLFDYHCPPNILADYDDAAMLAYLQQAYSKEFFVIENPAEINKYSWLGDRVAKKDDLKIPEWELKPGHPGVVKAASEKGDGLVLVKFKKGEGFQKIEPQLWIPANELLMYGDTSLLFHVSWKGFIRGSLGNFPEYNQPLSTINSPEKRRGFLVKYNGERRVQFKTFIPDGTEGIIFGRKLTQQGNNYAIAWANRPGLQFQYFSSTFQDGSTAWWPEYVMRSSDFRLIIPNTVPFAELLAKQRKEYEDDCRARDAPIEFP